MNAPRSIYLVLILFLIAACAGPDDVIVLLADEIGKVGKVTVRSLDGEQVVLEKALASAHIGADGLKKAQMKQVRFDIVLKTSSLPCRRTQSRLPSTSRPAGRY